MKTGREFPRRIASILAKVALAGIIVVVLVIAVLYGLFWYFGRPLSDDQMIRERFDPKLPGYSEIEILERKGERDVSNPRLLTIEVVMESYPESVVCRGEISYFRSDPSFLDVRWHDLECIGQYMLIQGARYYLRHSEAGPAPHCHAENIALVLTRWVEEDWIELSDIQDTKIRSRVNQLLQDISSLPTDFPSASLFQVPQLQVHDLAPELPEEEKVQVYVLRCDGTLELFLMKSRVGLTQNIALQIGDVVLSSPLTPPTIIP